MADKRPIGVFDSGLGGLTVVREIKKLLPNENIVYLGDTARVPYGTKSVETIVRYARENEVFLLKKGVKMIVAACGTVSSVASFTKEELPVPFIEVVSHSVKAAVKATKNKKIGILATCATIKSGAHKRQILSLLPDATVVESSGSLLVSLVEEGWTNETDTVVLETVRRYLAEMKEKGVDTVILGCTHFPVLKNAISEVLGEDVTLINMGVATAYAIKEQLEKTNSLNEETGVGETKFYASDKPQSFKKLAGLLLGEEIGEAQVEQVEIKGI